MSCLPFGSACFASGPKLVFRSVAVIANAVAITNLQSLNRRFKSSFLDLQSLNRYAVRVPSAAEETGSRSGQCP